MTTANPFFRLLPAVFACILMAGCVSPNVVYHSGSALEAPLHPSLTVLHPDAVVSLQTSGGLLEPRADWSEKAAQSFLDAMHAHLFDAGVDFTDAPAGSEDDEYAMWQSINLTLDAVELAMLKGSIGDSRAYVMDKAQRERVVESTGADYALALVFRSNRSSGGRIATSLLVGLAGVSMEHNRARFRCALIDLRDGHVKWANFDANDAMVSFNPDSDSEKQWRKVADFLMSEFPL